MPAKSTRPLEDIFHNRKTFNDCGNVFKVYLQQPPEKTPLCDRMEITLQLAFCEVLNGHITETKRLLDNCRDYILRHGKEEYKACVYHIECRLQLGEGNFEEGVAAGVKSLAIFRRLQFPFFTMNTSMICGHVCGRANLLVEAMDYFGRAHSLAVQIDDKEYAMLCMLNLNDARIGVFSTEECIFYSKELLTEIKTLYAQRPDNTGNAEMGVYVQLAHLYLKLNDADNAEAFANQAMDALISKNYLSPYHYTRTNLCVIKAEIAGKRGNEAGVIENVRDCTERARMAEKWEPELDANFVLFGYYMDAKNLPKAKEVLDYADSLLPGDNRSLEYLYMLKHKCSYYQAAGNIERELYHFKLAYDYTEYMQQQALAHRLKYTSLVHALEVRETEIEQQKADLNTKTQELNMSSYSLEQRNRLLNDLKESITDLKKARLKPELIFKTILKTIDRAFSREEDEKKIFREKFDASHREFIARLHQAHPLLTPTECRLCALLRSGFNSKEISNLLTMTTRNIENHRVRIRKKMQLSKDENLNLTLSAIA